MLFVLMMASTVVPWAVAISPSVSPRRTRWTEVVTRGGSHFGSDSRLASTVGPHGIANRIALGDQIVLAHSTAPLAVGTTAELTLRNAPRLLPWQSEIES